MLFFLPLVIASLLPAVLLCVYIYKKDRVKKEPMGLLLKLLGVGALCTIPAILLELAAGGILNAFFSGITEEELTDGELTGSVIAYHLINNVLCVALIEECCKFAGVWKLTARHPNYNSQFDGIVYCGFISLGFAGAENIGYVLLYGLSTALVRAFTAVPGHMFFGVFMGYSYSRWHVRAQAALIEDELRRRGYVANGKSAFNPRLPLFIAVAAPTLIHGAYDFCCSLGSALSLGLFIALVIALYIVCFIRIKKLSATDIYSGSAAFDAVARKYPQAAAAFAADHPEETAFIQTLGGLTAPDAAFAYYGQAAPFAAPTQSRPFDPYTPQLFERQGEPYAAQRRVNPYSADLNPEMFSRFGTQPRTDAAPAPQQPPRFTARPYPGRTDRGADGNGRPAQ